jgi:predicted ABC-type ATPase
MKRISLLNYVFVGKYKDIREKLDYIFHENYTDERQLFQDLLIDKIIGMYVLNLDQNRGSQPYLVYTAGAMGAGKTHTLRVLSQEGEGKYDCSLIIDPDRYREMLPEYQEMKVIDSLNAASYFQKESCILSEITLHIGLMRGYNIISDGSMINYQWYVNEITWIRQDYPSYRIMMIYVDADWDRIVERVENRCKITGRCINKDKLRSVWSKIPDSVNILKKYVDEYIFVKNNEHPVILLNE